MNLLVYNAEFVNRWRVEIIREMVNIGGVHVTSVSGEAAAEYIGLFVGADRATDGDVIATTVSLEGRAWERFGVFLPRGRYISLASYG